jgi:alkanesulfonate monooxygenase SsuD/methylene tetrahydromethanopterin reductase-like flavin-dependent oxidoreductase (luciferase family)
VAAAGKGPLKIGLYLPMAEGMMGGATPGWRDMLAMAQRAEQVGFDSVWIADHFISKEADGTIEGWWECCTLLAALAAATIRVEIGTGVICTAFRNPALLAKMADTIDEISGGRLILGIGAGWHDPEYVAFGYPTDHKFSRFEEALRIIHPLLKTGRVDFEGRYYSARECELRPRGPRPAGPPIMIASTSPKMLDLTARYADLWNGWMRHDPAQTEQPQELLSKLDQACADAARDPQTLPRVGMLMVSSMRKVDPPTGPRGPVSGSPEEIAEAMRAYARAGVSHLVVANDPETLAGLEALAPVLELLDKEG